MQEWEEQEKRREKERKRREKTKREGRRTEENQTGKRDQIARMGRTKFIFFKRYFNE